MDTSANIGHYLIQKVLIDLLVSSSWNTNEIHDQLKSFWYQDLQPGIEEIFDELNPEFLLKIDKLELNLGHIPVCQLSEGLSDNIIQAIKDQLVMSLSQASAQGTSPDLAFVSEGNERISGSRSLDALIFYLEEGYLPWWANDFSSQHWEEKFIQAFRVNESLFLKIDAILRRKAKAALRLLNLASHSMIELLFREYKRRPPAMDTGFIIVKILETILVRMPSNEPVKSSYGERTVIRLILLAIISAKNGDMRLKALRDAVNYLKSKEIGGNFQNDMLNDYPNDYPNVSTLLEHKHLDGARNQEIMEENDSYEEKILSGYYNMYEKKVQNSQLNILNTEFIKNQLNPEVHEHIFPNTESRYETADVSKALKVIKQNSERIKAMVEPENHTETDIYIDNAGLVLFHPFLEKYFLTLELLENKDFKSSDTQHRAAFMLQYLASGDDQAFDFKMILNKVLCGIAVDTPIVNGSPISSQEIVESKVLLESVIKNWGILKNTSIEGLREGFIRRSGKLLRRPNGYQLIVEQKGHDVLLDKLKWSIRTINNPWMDYPLYVEWI